MLSNKYSIWTFILFFSISFTSFSQTINFGEFVSGSISTTGESDAYSFSLSSSATIRITATCASSNTNTAFDPELELFNGAGTSLRRRDNINCSDVNITEILSAGNYTVRVTDWSDNDLGDYNLFLEKIMPAENSRSISFDEVLKDSIVVKGDIDLYTFNGSAGNFIRVTMACSSTNENTAFDPEVEIFAPDGTSLGRRDNINCSDVNLDIELTSSGTYTIIATDWSGNDIGDYNIFLEKLIPSENFRPIGYGEIKFDSLIDKGEIDLYTFVGSAGSFIRATMACNSDNENSAFDPELQIIAPDGTSLGRNDNINCSDVNLDVELPSSGTYTLIATDWSGNDIGKYNLFLEKLVVAENAVPLNYGDGLTDSIVVKGDIDLYTFYGSSGQFVRATMTCNSLNENSAFDPELQIIAPDGTSLGRRDNINCSDVNLDVELTQTGTYTLIATDWSGDDAGIYNLFLDEIVSSTNATWLEYGNEFTGAISSFGEFDLYTFYGNSGDYIRASMACNAAINDSAFDPEVQIIAPDGTSVGRNDNINCSDVNLDTELTQSGYYTLIATDWSGNNSGEYNLFLEKMNLYSDASRLAYDQTVSGQIDKQGQIDKFYFSAAAGETVRLNMICSSTNTNSAFDPEIQVFGPDNSTSGAVDVFNCGSRDLDYTAPVSGFHTVYITDWSGNDVGSYDLTLTCLATSCSDDNYLIPEFAVDTTQGIEGDSFSFQNTSQGSYNNVSWTFTGGTPANSTDENPTIIYNQEGVYPVELSISDGATTEVLTKTNYITITRVKSIPEADFEASATEILVGESVTFTDLSTNTPTSWEWTFPGGTPGTSTTQNPIITYTTAGSYSVSLTATNADGSDNETKTSLINVTTPPVVPDFASSIREDRPGSTINFTDQSTGNPTSWNWSFEGGTPATSEEQNPAIVYNEIGIYDVTLSISNGGANESVTKSGYIIISEVDGQLILDFTASNTTILKSESITFSDVSSGNPTSWSWTFDGGNPGSSAEQNPVVTYDTVGVYDVTLSVTNADSTATETREMYITVNSDQQLSVQFIADKTTIYEGDSITFTDQSTGDPNQWEWFFEGGTPQNSTEQNPTIVYNNPGNFDVILQIFQGDNRTTRTKSNYIEVLESPDTLAAGFTQNKTEILLGDSVAFTDQSSGTPIAWNWSFDGGSPSNSTEQNPVITYSQPGTYSVSLTVEDTATSESITKEDLIFVQDTVLAADFIADTTNITVGQSVQFTNRSSGQITNYEWSFEGGTPISSTLENPRVRYDFEGTYDVTLTVSEGQRDETVTKTALINVFDPQECASLEAVTTATGSFDDGSGPFDYFNNADCSWIIAATSVRSLAIIISDIEILQGDTLTIYDGGDESADIAEQLTNVSSDEIIVETSSNIAFVTFSTNNSGIAGGWTIDYQEALIADFTSDAVEIDEGNSVAFRNMSTGNYTSIEWTFENGDPETSPSENPTITYNEDVIGSFDVTLAISNDQLEDQITKSNYITVVEIPLSNNDMVKFEMYPNPTTRFIYVKSDEIEKSWILDMNGKVLLESSKKTLDLQEISTGTYIIKMQDTAGKIYSGKIVKTE